MDEEAPREENLPPEGVESEFTDGDTAPQDPRSELASLLEEDQSRLGDVYRLHYLDGLTPQQVADRLNIDTAGFVYSYRARIDAILDGKVSPSTHVKTQAASAMRAFMKRNRNDLSRAALQLLNSHLALHEQALAESTESELASTDTTELENEYSTRSLARIPGIYAFSYGWYLEHPVDEKTGNTLIKVGRAEDVGGRIDDHRRGVRTHIPEPLAVVRVYSTEGRDNRQVEQAFHRLLSTAGHDNPRRTSASRRNEVGQEWFLTNEAFLDAIASVLGLRTVYIGGSAFVEGGPEA